MRRRCEFVFETRMIMKGSFLHIVMYWNFAEGGFALSASNGTYLALLWFFVDARLPMHQHCSLILFRDA